MEQFEQCRESKMPEQIFGVPVEGLLYVARLLLAKICACTFMVCVMYLVKRYVLGGDGAILKVSRNSDKYDKTTIFILVTFFIYIFLFFNKLE